MALPPRAAPTTLARAMGDLRTTPCDLALRPPFGAVALGHHELMGTDGTAWAEGPGPDGNARVLVGRYRLEGRLGRGGMGVVWRATDRLLGRQVAVKELSVDEGDALDADEAGQRRERTLREARALAQLGHPHIIGVHDVIEADGRPYIVMELVDGPSLAELISRTGPVDAREAARIGIALLGALRKAHDSGVLHRDLKPANVLLETDTGRVVLTDFGIAQVTGAATLTESGSFLGSPEYTAPERMSGSRTGPESDLWSLGALLCAAVSGISPFRRDSLSAVLLAVVSDEIRVPAQAGELLPVIRGLLERDPDRRLDAAEAERMLRAYAETGRVPPLPPGAGPPAERGAARARRAPLGTRLSHLPLPHRLKGLSGGTAGAPTASSPTPRVLRRPHRAAWRGTRTRPSDPSHGGPGDTGAGREKGRPADGERRGDSGTDEFPQPPAVRESPRVWEAPEDQPPAGTQEPPGAAGAAGVPEQREPSDHTFAAQERPTAVAHPAAPEPARRPPATGGRHLPPTAGREPRSPAAPWSPNAMGPWPPADAEPWSTGSAGQRTSPQAGGGNGAAEAGGVRGSAVPAGPPRTADADRSSPGRRRTARTMLVTAVLVVAVTGTGVSAIALLVNGDGNGHHAPKSSAPASTSAPPSPSPPLSPSPSASRPPSASVSSSPSAPPAATGSVPSSPSAPRSG